MSRVEPVRTCVGCRRRDSKSALLRLVVGPADASGDGRPVVPDLTGRVGGRGAHLHPTTSCLDLAERRRAFGRALQVDGRVDLTPVRHHVAQVEGARAEG